MSRKAPTNRSKPELKELPLTALQPHPRNVRKHPPKQIEKLARNIRRFGFTSVVAVDEAGTILAGHARVEAARMVGLETVRCCILADLTAEQKLAFALADNKLHDESSFDEKGLNKLLKELAALPEFDLDLTGFDMGEIDFRVDGAAVGEMGDPDDLYEEPPEGPRAVTQIGDVWRLGPHWAVCGSALEASSYRLGLGNRKAHAVFTDPPYNCPVDGHVSGLGAVRHREFPMASGEMSTSEFQAFLKTTLQHAADASHPGAIHFVCMDWRQLQPLQAAGEAVYAELKNLCVWAKTNAGMGSLYRSQHELVLVFKTRGGAHRNNVELGRHGRHRSNVWSYPGANTFSRTRKDDLAVHPTVKPVALVADAIRDVTKRGELVLDPFLGSGTTILAAERSGRCAVGIELDPVYVDVTIRRWQRLTRKAAVLEGDGRIFDELAQVRAAQVHATQAEEIG